MEFNPAEKMFLLKGGGAVKAVEIDVTTQGSIRTVNGTSLVTDGQSMLVARRMQLYIPTGVVAVALTIISLFMRSRIT